MRQQLPEIRIKGRNVVCLIFLVFAIFLGHHMSYELSMFLEYIKYPNPSRMSVEEFNGFLTLVVLIVTATAILRILVSNDRN